MPTKGHARYDVWKTRLRKSRTNIETAKPSPAAQLTPLRRWFQTRQAVIGEPDDEHEWDERVIAEAIVDHTEVEQEGGEAVADDAVGRRAVADRVVPQRSRAGNEER